MTARSPRRAQAISGTAARVGDRADREDTTLIVHGLVMTLDPGDRVIGDGAVAIEGERIAAVGSTADLLPRFGEATVIDATGCAVLPGLVNAHSHLAGVLFRGSEDRTASYRPLMAIEAALGDEDVYWLSLVGAFEALRFGTTTVNDLYYQPAAVAAAVAEAGLRAVVAPTILEVDRAAFARGKTGLDPAIGRRLLEEAEAFADAALAGRWARVTPRLGPHAADTCSPDLLRRVAQAARERGLGLHMHVAQNRQEVRAVRDRTGRTPVELLDELGLLSPDLAAAHLGFVTGDEVVRLAAAGTAWAHCPASNAKRGYLAPVARLRAAGLRRGLGTDWLGYDMWEAMRWAIGVARLERRDPAGLDARSALREATQGGAAVLGLEREIGSLEPGKLADLILVALERPWLEPPAVDPVAGLVYNGAGRDVTTVMVGGRLLVADGRVQSPLLDEAIGHARRLAWAHRPGWEQPLAT